MGRCMRPIYICDTCGFETLDKNQVRCFVGNVTDGEGKHIFIGNNFHKAGPGKEKADVQIKLSDGMNIYSNTYCLSCLPKALGLDNKSHKVPEFVVEKIESAVTIPTEEYVSEYDTSKLLNELQEFKEEPEDQIVEFTPTPALDNIEVEIEVDSNNVVIADIPGIVEEIEEVEIPDSVEDLMQEIAAEKDDDEDIVLTGNPIEETGEFLVLGKIINDEYESWVAEFYKYRSVKELRETYGNSLIGVFVTTQRTVDAIPSDAFKTDIKYISKVAWGIPDVVSRELFVSGDGLFAFIPKEEFDESHESQL